MKHRIFGWIVWAAGMGFMASCLTQCTRKIDGTHEQLTETVDSFAYHYFNYHLKQACRFCTDDSQKWLELMASNIEQADVALLREQENEAEISYNEIQLLDTDTLKNIRLTVRNHFVKDSIGKMGRMVKKSVYDIQVVKRQGKWLVRMASPLRSEKRSRD